MITAHWKKSFILPLIFCLYIIFDYAVYYISINRCRWQVESSQNYINTLILTDVHVTGSKDGSFYDRWKREWEMSIAYRIIINKFKPELILFLGDTLDEGYFSSDENFRKDFKKFQTIFPSLPSHKRIFVPGNHDVGFHDEIIANNSFRIRFEKAFNTSLADITTIKNVHFISVNTMALGGDKCKLCFTAKQEIDKVYRKYIQSCFGKNCGRPILLQHFPLYRESDEVCNEVDSRHPKHRKMKFTENYWCLPKHESEYLLKKIKPRVSFCGHNHYGCVINYTRNGLETREYTVSSFNPRNHNTPGFLLAQFSNENFHISKCFLPDQRYLFVGYLLGLLFILYSIKLYNSH